MPDTPLLMSIQQAAEYLGLTRSQLYQITRNRSRVRQAAPIPVVRLGKRIAFRRDALELWIRRLEMASAQEVRP
jgi:excisionase family DNA binding protein